MENLTVSCGIKIRSPRCVFLRGLNFRKMGFADDDDDDCVIVEDPDKSAEELIQFHEKAIEDLRKSMTIKEEQKKG